MACEAALCLYSDVESALLADFDEQQRKIEADFSGVEGQVQLKGGRHAVSAQELDPGHLATHPGAAAPGHHSQHKTVTIAQGAEVEIIHGGVTRSRCAAPSGVPLWTKYSVRSLMPPNSPRVAAVTSNDGLAQLIGVPSARDDNPRPDNWDHADCSEDELGHSSSERMMQEGNSPAERSASGQTMTKKDFQTTFLVSNYSGRKLQSYSMYVVEELINVKDRCVDPLFPMCSAVSDACCRPQVTSCHFWAKQKQ